MKIMTVLRTTGLALGVALLAACASNPTKVGDVWVAPGVAKIEAERVIVVALAPNEAARMRMESEMSARMSRLNPQSSNIMLSAAELKDPAGAVAKIKAAGYDMAMVMRLIDTQNYTLSQPQAMQAYMGSSNYYTRNMATTSTNYVIETTIFDVTGGQPLVRVTTETFQTADASVLADRLFESIRTELRTRGLIP